jgi:hypothetical protein
MQIPHLGVELFNADGQTGRRIYISKLTVAFRNFANVRKTQT